jgi:predicted N-acetyltransferase YhbS
VFQLNRETDSDWWEVEALYDLCFAPGREALSSYRLREATPPIAALSQVARDRDGILAGAIRYWPVCVGQSPCALAWADCRPPNPAGRGAGRLFDSRKPGPRARVLAGTGCCWWGTRPITKDSDSALLSGVEMPPPTNPKRILGMSLTPAAWEGVQGQVTRAQS